MWFSIDLMGRKYERFIALNILLCIILLCNVSAELHSKKVAVIGAGIGGSSAVYFLRKFIPEPWLEITVFEKHNQVGGRVTDCLLAGKVMELGADIYHEGNLVIKELVEGLDLGNETSEAERIGVWNGKEFLFEEGHWQLINIAKAIYRYGIQTAFLDGIINKELLKFMEQYNPNSPPWESIEEWLSRFGFTEYMHYSMEKYLLKNQISQLFIDEIGNGITKVIYQQEISSIHSMGGVVAFLGSGGSLFKVADGNRLIMENALKKARVDLRMQQKVVTVEKTPEGSYIVTTPNGQEDFDAVIMAVPFALADITLIGIDPPEKLNYVNVYVTLVHGHPNASYFGHTSVDSIPTYIVTPKNSSSTWTVFSVSSVMEDGSRIIKIFSPKAIDEEEQKRMFSSIIEKKEVSIYAYPYLSVGVPLPSYKLAPDFYYVNAFESILSAMEGSALSAKNAARLLAKSWTNQQHQPNINQKQQNEEL